MMNDKRLPIFLQTINGKSFYKIEDEKTLIEYQIIGSKYILHEMVAKILPERNLVLDMIANLEERWVPITEEEFNEKKKYCIENLVQVN